MLEPTGSLSTQDLTARFLTSSLSVWEESKVRAFWEDKAEVDLSLNNNRGQREALVRYARWLLSFWDERKPKIKNW